MPHGGEDWGTVGPLSTIYTVEDLGELATRLGSIVTFDRRGNVIWLDDFESGINKWYALSLLGGSMTWDAVRAYHGAFSCKMATSANTDAYRRMRHYFTYPAVTKMGFEFAHSMGPEAENLITLLVTLIRTDYRITAGVQYSKVTGQWQYWDGAWHNITPTQYLHSDVAMFNVTKMVIDLATAKYVRLISNNTTFDLSDKSCQEGVVGAGDFIEMYIQVTAIEDEIAQLWVDNVIVTQNEP